MTSTTLVIAIPFSGRFVPPEWAMSMATLSMPMNTNYSYLTIKGMKRDLAREHLVERALETGARYIMFIDDDTAPPSFAVHELMYTLDNADDDVMFCGGVYCTKTNPPAPVISQDSGDGPFWKWKTGQVFPIGFIGTGCLMIKTEVFKKIEKPWFRDVTTVEEAIALGLETSDAPSFKYNMTDDIFFCTKLQKAGLKGLAHGGVLPVHFDQDGNPFALPLDSYPVRHGTVSPIAGFGFTLTPVHKINGADVPEIAEESTIQVCN